MKLTILLLTAALFSSYASGLAQNVTISGKDLTFKQIFTAIEKQTGYVVFGNKELFASKKTVSLTVHNMPLRDFLDIVLKDQPFEYTIDDKTVFISKKTITPSSVMLLANQLDIPAGLIDVRGRIVNEKGEPVVATVLVKGTRTGTNSNTDGYFELKGIDENGTLVISGVGIESFEVPINGKTDLGTLEAKMRVTQEEDIVVVGYGQQRKISLTGAQSSVKVEELQNRPVANLSTLLAGRISGLVGVQRSGLPGSNAADIWIRGISTFGSNSNSPLVLVDGVQGRSINDFDPEDIASFTILKDASATAVYGSLGANGVIIINTKRGKPGKVNLMVNYNEGITAFTKTPEMADAKTYMETKNEAMVASGLSPEYSQEYIDNTLAGTDPNVYPNVDWINSLFKNTSSNRRLNFSASGGSENTRFYTSLAYYDETSLLKTDALADYDAGTRFQRYNFTSNIDMNWTKTTRFFLGITGYITNYNEPGDGAEEAFGQAMSASPVRYPVMYPGNLVSGIALGATPSPNPWARVTQSGYVNTFSSKIASTATLTQDLGFWVPGLSVNGMYSFDTWNQSYQSRTRQRSVYYINKAQPYKTDGSLNLEQVLSGSDNLSYSYGNDANRQFSLQGQITYERSFGNHRVYAMGVYNQKSQIYPFSESLADAIPFRQQNFGSRITYSYIDRYFIEFNGGYNGSEDYAPSNRFGFFPSLSAGWIISKEKFFDPLSGIFQFFKIRYSDGLAGAPGTGLRFGFLTLVTSEAIGIRFGTPGGNTTYNGVNISQYGAEVSWAKSRKRDLGVEFNILNNKLSFVLDYFNEHRTKVFLTRTNFPNYAGLQYNPVGNYGTVDNYGFDGTVDLAPVPINDKLSIAFRGTFTFNKDRLVENGAAPYADPYMERRGQNVLAGYGYIAEGLFQSQKEIDNSPDQSYLGSPRVGDIKYKDLNGDGAVDSYDVTKITRGDVPSWVYGFGFNINYGQFYLSAFFQGVAGAERVISDIARIPFGITDGNVFSNITDRWTEENPVKDPFYPRLAYGSSPSSNNNQASTWWVKDISFIRLKTFDIGYNLPKGSFSAIGLKNARFYLSGVNLFYISKFKLWDPEMNTGNGNTYPNTRNISIGVQANF